MNRFESQGLSEGERQQRAAVGLSWRVNEILSNHPRTMNMDIRDVNKPLAEDEQQHQNELIKMSANNHMKCLAAFYKRLHPDAKVVKVVDGMHSALPLYDTVTGRNIMLLATNLELTGDRSLGAISVTVRDEYVLTGSTIYLNDDGDFEAYSDVKPRDDKLVTEALELVGVGKRDLVVPILSGIIPLSELAESLSALRPIVAEKYDEEDVEKFLADLEKRYHEKAQSRATADELGLSRMTSDEIEDTLTILEQADNWS